MEIIGFDKDSKKLLVGDICKFKIYDTECEGMIMYDYAEFAYIFKMEDSKFPAILMNKVDMDSIEKIINVAGTKVNDNRYKFYQELMLNQ